MKKELQITQESENGIRADKFLATQLPDISRSKIKLLIDSGKVILNGSAFADCSYRVQLNDTFIISIVKQRAKKIKPKDINFEIVYEDEHLLVINKPAGLTVHPGAGNHENTLVNALLHYCGDSLSSISGEARPGIVHRLDKDTSGLMLVAKSDIVHAKLAEQLEKREIQRIYHALVYGVPVPIAGKININIGRSRTNHKIMAIMKSGGKTAITHYRVLKTFYDTLSLIECKLETGRTHQIRLHMLYKKHPIIGDVVYSKGYNFNLSKLPEDLKEQILNVKRQFLHAAELNFTHPITYEQMKFKCNYPDDINNVFKTMLYK